MATMSMAHSQTMPGGFGATAGTARSMAWTGAGTAEKDDSMEGLMSTLRSVTANSLKAHHQNLLAEIGDPSLEETKITSPLPTKKMEKLPHIDDLTEPRFKEPPKMDTKLKAELKANKTSFKPFQSMNQTVGHAFGDVKPLQPKVLDTWTAGRTCEPTRNHRYPGCHQLNRALFNSTNPEPKPYPKGLTAFDGNRQLIPGFTGFRFHAQSEPIPGPTDDMCSGMHRKWLKQHAVVRDREIYPVYHALEALDEAKAIKLAHEQRRQMARDMMSRRQLNPPKFSANVMRTLNKVKKAVATSHAFHANAGIKVSSVADEEKADKARLHKAASAPVLQIPKPGPKGRVDHLRSWKGPERTIDSSFRRSTPWRDDDLVREMRSTT